MVTLICGPTDSPHLLYYFNFFIANRILNSICSLMEFDILVVYNIQI